jgi:hypothetical protein
MGGKPDRPQAAVERWAVPGYDLWNGLRVAEHRVEIHHARAKGAASANDGI